MSNYFSFQLYIEARERSNLIMVIFAAGEESFNVVNALCLCVSLRH